MLSFTARSHKRQFTMVPLSEWKVGQRLVAVNS